MKWFLARVANDRRALVSQVQRLDPSAVPVLDSKALCLSNQKMIHVGSIPMRIGDIIVRARRHQQLIRKSLMKEAEPALQTTSDLRIRALPAAPFSQRSNPW